MSSNVHVIVRFKERCVFAGEEFNCIITFKNVADSNDVPVKTPTIGRAQSRHNSTISQSSRNALLGTIQPRTSQGKINQNQPSFSLSNPPGPKNSEQANKPPRPDIKHQRSVSIVSVGSPNLALGSDKPFGSPNRKVPPGAGHRRSSTVQHSTSSSAQRRPSPGRQLSSDPRTILKNGQRSPLSLSQLSSNTTTPENAQDFRFPPDNLLNANTPESGQGTPVLGPRQNRHIRRTVPNHNQAGSHLDNADMYAHSNHSQETAMSEQPSIMSDRPQLPNLLARAIQRPETTYQRKPEIANLLMGYAQVNATFTLEASLVDQAPFEDVKKKGFLGGQAGGGVVGVKKKARPSSSLFSSFGFSSLGESLDSIMGGDNLSSVREMKAVTNSRAIPLLSTPQSLLFVDLHLEPGDEKSYSFSFKVPRGLPSSYRGKAIKITYNLTIGVQGAPGQQEMQAVRQVNVPIRVFSGVDSDGEIFGHDLMQPYVMLKDMASVKTLEMTSDDTAKASTTEHDEKVSAEEFLAYVDKLLDKNRRRQSSSGTIDAMFGTFASEKSAAVRAINRAVMLSNQITASSESSPNRFEIARNGLKIATVVLDRPLHRLGETVVTVIDLSDSQMTCTTLKATLESAERVSSSLAVRSASAISRITKKVYASNSENILFADRAVFNPTIPVSATPTFVTSGVNLDWYVKLEFGTVRTNQNDTNSTYQAPTLLEEVIDDERGSVNVAVESLECDTFEVLIPITVYGDFITDGKEDENLIGIPI